MKHDTVKWGNLTPHYEAPGVTLFHGDCLDVLRDLPDESVHAVVTDPPYGLEFMGKAWDSFGRGEAQSKATAGIMSGGISAANGRPSFLGGLNPKCKTCGKSQRGGSPCTCERPDFTDERGPRLRAFQAWCEEWAIECMRVLKPGGHLLAFGGSRTWHRLAAGIEDAGFEMRDSIAWLYGSGFPKSLDVAKQIDGVLLTGKGDSGAMRHANENRPGAGRVGAALPVNGIMADQHAEGRVTRTEAATDEAREWQGWGTALKPAFEPIVVARKPLVGTVAANVLAHGTGALNIDANRVHSADSAGQTHTVKRLKPGATLNREGGNWRPDGEDAETFEGQTKDGRWPANVILDETQAAELDRQAPDTGGSGRASGPSLTGATGASAAYGARNGTGSTPFYGGEKGGASRMFPTFRYEAKAPTSERPVVDGVAHPTVKPLDLMRWLVRLVTPKGGTVLEPFAGSGTTVEACIREGFDVIAIEREADYLPLIEKRIRKDHAQGLDFDWGDVA